MDVKPHASEFVDTFAGAVNHNKQLTALFFFLIDVFSEQTKKNIGKVSTQSTESELFALSACE